MAEFAAATERMRGVRPRCRCSAARASSAAIRITRRTETIARLLSDAGFAVISAAARADGGREPRRVRRRSPAIGLDILLPHEQSGNEFQDVGFDFRYFFARKMMFVRFASAYVVLPGGFGTLDELSECLTLVQTGKSRRIPIILVGGEFWRGLLDWIGDRLVGEGMIDAEDLTSCRSSTSRKRSSRRSSISTSRGFQPTREERQRMLNL